MSKICNVEGCGGNIFARGICQKHYARLVRYGSPTGQPEPKPRKICTVDGCNSPHYGNGYCNKHYLRNKRNGHPLAGKPTPKPSSRKCMVDGCDAIVGKSGGKDMCCKHYIRYRLYGSPEPKYFAVDGHTSKWKREYSSWSSMKDRCLNCNHIHYRNYGGRGIKICPRWLGPNGFNHFLDDMGARPKGHSLDRIDNNGDYCPENCKWSTPKEQAQNRRPKRKATGQDLSDCEACKSDKSYQRSLEVMPQSIA